MVRAMNKTSTKPSLTAHTFAARRAALFAAVDRPIVLLGNGVRARNLPMTPLPFRQDSTFLYFTGCKDPDAAVLIDAAGARLYLPEPGPDDALWHGETADFSGRRDELGVEHVRPRSSLAGDIADLAGGFATLAVADEERNRWLKHHMSTPLKFGEHYGDDDLVDAVIRQRRSKTAAELDEMRAAAKISAIAHHAVAAAIGPGVTERSLAAVFRAVLDARGCTEGYPTILTRRGDILHNFHQRESLQDGDLLLVDGGGEVESGYGVDITRTWPVSGTFSPRQRAAYDAVLQAQHEAIALCTVGTPYREVHDAASLVIARFLADEKLLRVAPEDAVQAGAHAIFFPHGVGHLLGMDVHDLENFGDRPSYPRGVARPEPFGTRYLRLNLPLEAGWVVTVEPGFYVVPAILADPVLVERFAAMVDFDAARRWIGFGGIRIEDDIAVSSHGPDNLTAAVAKDVADIERRVGRGLNPAQIFALGAPAA